MIRIVRASTTSNGRVVGRMERCVWGVAVAVAVVLLGHTRTGIDLIPRRCIIVLVIATRGRANTAMIAVRGIHADEDDDRSDSQSIINEHASCDPTKSATVRDWMAISMRTRWTTCSNTIFAEQILPASQLKVASWIRTRVRAVNLKLPSQVLVLTARWTRRQVEEKREQFVQCATVICWISTE